MGLRQQEFWEMTPRTLNTVITRYWNRKNTEAKLYANIMNGGEGFEEEPQEVFANPFFI